jgi:MoxR-like ATPase
VSCKDVQSVALPVFRHRLVLNFAAEAEGISTDDVVRRLLQAVPANEQ